MNELKELDITKIIEIPSDVEIPVHDNIQQTRRALCASYPENRELVDKLEAVFTDNLTLECSSDLFKYGDYTLIDNIEELKKRLSELLIRFDIGPDNYTKQDYLYLISVLYKSLLHLYKGDMPLAPVAYSGDIADLIQKEYFILDCGSSTQNI